jgi:ferredoxin-NADP reductase
LVTRGWRRGVVVEAHRETPSGRAIVLEVPGWGGNDAGQHLDIRLTAEDGYQAARSYSVASVGRGDRVQIAVDRLPDGEVSPFLVDDLMVGDELEVRGPLGAWFVWRSDQAGPVQLIGGGSGIVPLIAMIRARAQTGDGPPFRLLYSVRNPEDAFFREELEAPSPGLVVTWRYTRSAPEGWPGTVGRVTRAVLEAETLPASDGPTTYVCGPTGFVEAVATVLVALGHDPARVKTERFGGT